MSHTYPSLLRAYLRPHRRRLGALAAVLVVSMALPLAGPQLLRRFIDQAVGNRPQAALVGTAIAYLAVALVSQALAVVVTAVATRTAWSVTNQARHDVAAHALSLDLGFHGRHAPGEMIERVDGDATALSEFFTQFVLRVVGSAIILAGVVVLTYREDWRVGIAVTVFAAVAGFTVHRMRNIAVPAATAERETSAQLFGAVEERLAGIEDIRANGAAAHVVHRFHVTTGVAHRAFMKAERTGANVFVVTNVVYSVGSALILVLGIALLRSGTLTVGTVYLLFQYTQMVRRPLESISDQLRQFQAAAAGATRIGEILAVRTVLPEPAAPQPLPTGALSIELAGVTFAYGDEEPVLHDLHLDLAAGRCLGLIGRTGSGKTTIGRLLLRLYDPQQGEVRLGGIDLRTVSSAELRRRVAVVTQDVQLFRASVRDNLTMFGSVGIEGRDLDRMLAELGLGPWLERLPEGLDTVLGPAGSGLSAGEAQLLALGRAFLLSPDVVVLDEASSRLDPVTEAVLERATSVLLAGRTAVLIAHRLGTLDRADDIAMLRHGHLVEHGARAALLADASSRFAGLVSASGEVVAS